LTAQDFEAHGKVVENTRFRSMRVVDLFAKANSSLLNKRGAEEEIPEFNPPKYEQTREIVTWEELKTHAPAKPVLESGSVPLSLLRFFQ